MKCGIFLMVMLSSTFSFAGPVFNGERGLVVIEAEEAGSSLGDWEKKTDVVGFTGTAHLEFSANSPSGGPPGSELKYRFTVDKDGIYRIMIRAHKRLEGANEDNCNDCYIRLEGDFTADDVHELIKLQTDQKFFGGSSEGWDWAVQMDINGNLTEPVYNLKAGEKYTLYISGRSKRFNIDRIVICHESVSDSAAQRK